VAVNHQWVFIDEAAKHSRNAMNEASLPPLDAPEEEDNYITAKYSFGDRLKYWTGGAIDDNMMALVQHAIVIEAAKTMVSSLKQKTAVQEEIIQTTFLNIAKGLLDTHVVTEAQHGQFTKKMYNSKGDTLDGKIVRGRYLKVKKTIGNELMP